MTTSVILTDTVQQHPSAPFRGHVVVFTGKLACLTRRAAQAKVRELGGATADDVTQQTTMLVVGEVGFLSKIDKSRKLRTAEGLTPRVQIVSETVFCTLAGLPTVKELKQHLYPLRDIRALYPQLREDRVRYLEACGAVHAKVRTNADRFYDFPALLVFRHAHQKLAEGLPLRSVVRGLRVEPQLALNFSQSTPARVMPLRRRRSEPIESAEAWFERACALEEDLDTVADARATYERALQLDPNYVPALVNLGNLHYGHGRLAEARACYEQAVQLEPGNAKARFNLGNVFHDQREYQTALILFRDAVALDPDFADAFFNLALTCEQVGLVDEARSHWRRYLGLDPTGEWAIIAREHLSAGGPP